jgi:hypothetical protein
MIGKEIFTEIFNLKKGHLGKLLKGRQLIPKNFDNTRFFGIRKDISLGWMV